jgi:hypothetical protein
MSRLAIAFFVAPLWVPLIIAPYSAFEIFPDPAQWRWVVIATIISAIFSYLGVFALGYPAFLALRSRNLTALWIAAALGFVVGALIMLVFQACLALALGEGSQGFGLMFQEPPSLLIVGIIPPGLLGALVGTTLWLIARPDRRQRNVQSTGSV